MFWNNKKKKEQKTTKQNYQMYENSNMLFAKVYSAELVSSTAAMSKYIWKYQVCPANLTWAGTGFLPETDYRVNTSPPAPLYDAFSISELGNNPTNVYSYGVPAADLPAGVLPVRIPDGTPVVCIAQRLVNTGQMFYLIINAQAITGECT